MPLLHARWNMLHDDEGRVDADGTSVEERLTPQPFSVPRSLLLFTVAACGLTDAGLARRPAFHPAAVDSSP